MRVTYARRWSCGGLEGCGLSVLGRGGKMGGKVIWEVLERSSGPNREAADGLRLLLIRESRQSPSWGPKVLASLSNSDCDERLSAVDSQDRKERLSGVLNSRNKITRTKNVSL